MQRTKLVGYINILLMKIVIFFLYTEQDLCH